MFLIHDVTMILQDCMDVLKVEPASCCETCLTPTHDGNDVTTNIKLESVTEVQEEEDPLLITSADVKTESEVSSTYFALLPILRKLTVFLVLLDSLDVAHQSLFYCRKKVPHLEFPITLV
jgi:hypothetical protein